MRLGALRRPRKAEHFSVSTTDDRQCVSYDTVYLARMGELIPRLKQKRPENQVDLTVIGIALLKKPIGGLPSSHSTDDAAP